MSKRNLIVSIDVGTTKICTTVAEASETNRVQVAGVGISPSNGLHKGLVVNINEAKEAIRDSVRKAEQASGYKVESAYVGVTGRHVTSLNNQGVVAITRNDRLVRPDDLRRVLQNAQNIKVPSDRKLLHIIPRHYSVDGQTGVQDPVGMHGFRLDVETHVITAAVASIQNMTKCIRGIGIDIDDLVLEPLASGESVLSEHDKQAGVVLADIGGGTTDVAIFKDGSIWHTAILPVAGYQLTRDIAIGLGLPFEVAEEMKKRYGTVYPDLDEEEASANISKNGHGISHRELSEIVRARAEEILRLIVLELPRSDREAIMPAGLVLTGGSSNLDGLANLGEDILGLPVRIGSPFNVPGISDALCDPAYATSVGLMLWGAKHTKPQNWKPFKFNFGLKKLVTQMKNLFG